VTRRDAAVVRLDAALGAEARARESHLAARSHARRTEAFGALRAASHEVTARETSLAQIDSDHEGDRVTVNGRAVGGVGSIFA
jgi:hypothetical protein